MKTGNLNISNLLKSLPGFDFAKFDSAFLNKSLQKRITEMRCSLEEYISILKQDSNEGENLTDSLHISYSEFFRNMLTFSVLEHIIFPSLIYKEKDNKIKEIRIWTAACAAGQEAYSLAILLEEMNSSNKEKISYRIFATDQNSTQLNEARAGKYKPASLNNMSMLRLNNWFNKNGDSYEIKTELKKNIDFSEFDLFNEKLSHPPASIFGDFDIVICANLLFYYKPEFREKILKKTTNCLAKGGYLITGEVERKILINNNYHEVFPRSAIFQIK